MKTKNKQTGKAASIPAGATFAAITSLGISAIGSLLVSWLVAGDRMKWESVGYGIMVILFLASFLGALIASSMVRHRRGVVCMLAGVTYYVCLLSLTALFFGGRYYGMGVTALMIVAGSGCAALVETGGKGQRNYRKYKVKNC